MSRPSAEAPSVEPQTAGESVVALDVGTPREEAAETASGQDQVSSGGAVRRGARRLWKAVKVGVVLLVLAGLAASIYFGWPVVNERYIEPIRSNTAGVTEVQGRVEVGEAQLAGLEAQVAELAAAEAVLPERLASLEAAIASLQEAQGDLDSRLGTVEGQIEGHTRQLALLDEVQETLNADLASATVDAGRQVALLKSMELMSRARLYLYQANYGLAEQDVLAARNLLADALATAPDVDTDVMTETVFRLERTLEALPDRPVAAVADLDIAWQVLLGEIPVAEATAATSDAETTTEDATTTTAAP